MSCFEATTNPTGTGPLRRYRLSTSPQRYQHRFRCRGSERERGRIYEVTVAASGSHLTALDDHIARGGTERKFIFSMTSPLQLVNFDTPVAITDLNDTVIVHLASRSRTFVILL